jgi:hypothetical protein
MYPRLHKKVEANTGVSLDTTDRSTSSGGAKGLASHCGYAPPSSYGDGGSCFRRVETQVVYEPLLFEEAFRWYTFA